MLFLFQLYALSDVTPVKASYEAQGLEAEVKGVQCLYFFLLMPSLQVMPGNVPPVQMEKLAF